MQSPAQTKSFRKETNLGFFDPSLSHLRIVPFAGIFIKGLLLG